MAGNDDFALIIAPKNRIDLKMKEVDINVKF